MSSRTVDLDDASKENGQPKDYRELLLQERLAKLSEELNAKVDQKIKERLDSDRNFVSTMVGNGVKLLGYAVALVTIVIGIAGVKSCSDINHAITSAATDAVNKKLETDNPNSDFNRLTNRLLNRALLDSYLTSLTRIKSVEVNDTRARIQVRRKFPRFTESQDAKRLTQMLFEPSTELSDFKDALQVLDYTGSLGPSMNPELLELTLAQDNKYSWIRGVPEKRVELLKTIKNPRILPVLQTLIANESSPGVKIAAIQASGQVGDITTMKALEELAAKENAAQYKDAAIIALARYNPQHPLVTGWAENIKKDKVNVRSQVKVLLLALEMMKGRPNSLEGGLEGPDNKLRLNLAKGFFSTVIANGFRLVPHPYQPGLALVRASRAAGRTSGESGGADDDESSDFDAPSVPSELLFGAGAEAVTSLLNELAGKNDTAQLARLIDAVSLRSGKDTAAVVEVELSEGSSIRLKDNTTLNAESAPNGVKLKTLLKDNDGEVALQAEWNDAAGAPQKRLVAAFDHPDALTFKLSEIKASSSSES